MTEQHAHIIRIEMGHGGYFMAYAHTIGMSDDDVIKFENGLATNEQAKHAYAASRAFAEKLMCAAPAGTG